MDAIQENMNSMMSMFTKRMDAFEEKQASKPGTPTSEGDNLALEFATFKTFVMTSLRALQAQIEVLARQVDLQEMHGRRKILLIHGVREESNEDTSAVVARVLAERLKLNALTAGDISRSHRMGRAGSADKPRPILFKLRDVSLRGQIWASKTALKGSGLTLSEFLTKSRHEAFMSARQQFGVTKCWTRDGIVFVMGPDGSRHRVVCLADLETISAKNKSKPATAPKSTSATVAAAQTKTRRIAKK